MGEADAIAGKDRFTGTIHERLQLLTLEVNRRQPLPNGVTSDCPSSGRGERERGLGLQLPRPRVSGRFHFDRVRQHVDRCEAD
jgi:hypothetical protein